MGEALNIVPTVLSHAIIAFIAASAGLVIGGMLAWSKVGGLYDRLERAEAVNREMAQMLREMAEALHVDLTTLPGQSGEERSGCENTENQTPAARLWTYLNKLDLSSPPRTP